MLRREEELAAVQRQHKERLQVVKEAQKQKQQAELERRFNAKKGALLQVVPPACDLAELLMEMQSI